MAKNRSKFQVLFWELLIQFSTLASGFQQALAFGLFPGNTGFGNLCQPAHTEVVIPENSIA